MSFLTNIPKSIFGFFNFKKPSDDFRIINGVVCENTPSNQESHADQPPPSEKIKRISTHPSQPPPPQSNSEIHNPIEEIQVKKGRLPKIDRFFTSLKASGKAKRTIQEYKYEFRWWTRQAEKQNKTLYTLNISDIENILAKNHPSTARRKISFLRTLSKWYLREGKKRLHIEVLKFIAPKIPKRVPNDLGSKKFKEIREQAKELCANQDRVGVWLGLMLMCGLRISEIQTVTIHNDKRIKVLGKGNKERLVPITDWLMDSIKQIERKGKNGWAKNRNIIYRHVRKCGYKPHSLRHTYASELLRREKNIEEISVLLGHEDISTTSIYTRVNISADSAQLLDS
jgi:integrase/recombinase XerD